MDWTFPVKCGLTCTTRGRKSVASGWTFVEGEHSETIIRFGPGCEAEEIGKRLSEFDGKGNSEMDDFGKFLDYLGEKPVSSLFLGVIVLFVGILQAEIPRGIASHFWPTTQGVITSSKVELVCCSDEASSYHG
jgi:hypothetical protein